ncbi:MAG: GNAT family N-acetyltransferase [Clostridia bacterium]|nr:GNAT family N-acetyltransferase [Clostridia bacterium]
MRIEVFTFLPDDAKSIRIEVFVIEQGFTEEFDTDDERAIHFVGYVDDNAIATCRVLSNGDGSYFIGRIAVRQEYRKKNFGAQIVNRAEEYIKANGGHTIYIHSQEQAVPFYTKIGYKDTGKRDFEEGCPHRMLIKQI